MFMLNVAVALLVCVHSNVCPFMCEMKMDMALGGSWQEVTVWTSPHPPIPSLPNSPHELPLSKHASTGV